TNQPWAAAALTSLSFFAAQIQLATWWSTATEITGKHVGALFGMMNMIGAAGAFTSQVSIGIMADKFKDQGLKGLDQWNPAFFVFSAVYVVGFLSWLMIDASKRVDEPEQLATDLGSEMNGEGAPA